MDTDTLSPSYKDRSLILKIAGGLLLLLGTAMAFLGPVEMYCFYLFSEGGRFHYEGFGFGSFMFGNIACQIMGYYLIAIVLIPLGYGHLMMRRWARRVTLALIWFWLITGIPLLLVFAFILFSSKDLSLAAALIAAVLLALSYFVLPWLLFRFYRSKDVTLSFENNDTNTYWIETLPIPILVLGTLFVLYVVALHVLIFFNGLYPILGRWAVELRGISLIAISILCLVLLIWGTLHLKKWAWWGDLLYFSWMSITWVVTLAQSSWAELLYALGFPPFEVTILQNLPFQGIHFAVLLGLPLTLTMGLIVYTKGYFEA